MRIGQILPAMWIIQPNINNSTQWNSVPCEWFAVSRGSSGKHFYASLEPISRFDLTQYVQWEMGNGTNAYTFSVNQTSIGTEENRNSIRFSWNIRTKTQIQIWHQSDWPSHFMRIECQSIDCSLDFRASNQTIVFDCTHCWPASFQLVLFHFDLSYFIPTEIFETLIILFFRSNHCFRLIWITLDCFAKICKDEANLFFEIKYDSSTKKII